LLGRRVGRGDLGESFGDVGQRRRSPVTREHSIGKASQLTSSIAQAGHRRSQLAATTSGDGGALLGSHRLGRVGETLDIGGVFGGGDVERPVDPRRPAHRRRLCGLLALALGLEPLHERVASRHELVGRGRQQIMHVLLVQAHDDTHASICMTSCTPAMRSTRSMCGLTPIRRSLA
jgi:hypothetical protein